MVHRNSLFVGFLLVTVACTKPAPPPVATVAPSDHVARSPVGTTLNILQKTFTLQRSAEFSFEVPPHAATPHLHGIFQSFVGQMHGASDDSANIEFLILTEDQHSAFVSNRPADAIFSADASHSQAVNFDLPAAFDQGAKYYLVFRNPDGKKASKVVEASFRVDF